MLTSMGVGIVVRVRGRELGVRDMANEVENISKVVEALKKVPPKRLLLIELANSIPIKHGMLDIDVLAEKQREINLAVAEAKAYGSRTIMAVDALVSMRARKEV